MKTKRIVCLAISMAIVIASGATGSLVSFAQGSGELLPFAYYSFDDSSNIGKDIVGTNNLIQRKNSPAIEDVSFVPGAYGNGAHFNGNNALSANVAEGDTADFFDRKFGGEWWQENKDLTLSFFFKNEETGEDGSNQRIMSNGIWGNTGLAIPINMYNDWVGYSGLGMNLGYGLQGGGVSWNWQNATLSENNSYDTTNWHHIAVTFDKTNNTAKYYLDGTLRNTEVNALGFELSQTWFVLTFGALMGPGFGDGQYWMGESFKGIIDEIKIFDTILSANNVYDLANTNTNPDLPVSFGSHVLSDNIVSNIQIGSTVDNFLIGVDVRGDTVLEFGNLTTENTLKTGSTIKVKIDGVPRYTYTALIYGDVNGDGLVELNDLVSIRNDLLEILPLSGIYKQAGDLYGEDKITLNDLVGIMAVVSENGSINQNPIF